MPLFPSLPEDLEAVEADELRGLLEQFQTIGASLAADMQRPVEERELIPADATPAELTAAIRAAAEDKLRIEAELDVRTKAEGTFLVEFNEGLAALGVETEPVEALAAEDEDAPDDPSDPDPEPDDDGAVTAEASAEVVVELPAEDAAEEVVEEPAEPAAVRMAIPRGSSRMTPRATPAANGGAVVTAHGGLGSISVREGTPLNRLDVAEKLVALAKKLRVPEHVKGGGREFFPVASAQFSFPDEFTLTGRQDDNLEKIRAVASSLLGHPEELEIFQASGGICAPPTPFYDVPGFASRARPVRDALPSFNAVRGGVSIPSVNIVDRADGGVTVIEESEDAQGGTFATKACRDIECATWTDTFIGIISHCLEVGTLNNRTWPEGVALELDNLMAGHAATAETRLLNRIRALSVKATAVSPYNAVHGLIYAILRAQASIANILRSERDASYTALIPEWMTKLMVADLAAQSSMEERYAAAAQVERYLSQLNVNVGWYKDSPTVDGSVVDQNFAEQVDGATLDNFPLTAEIGLFLNGAFIHLDGGSQELGLVRDSTLNHLNNHELFGEDFENVARVGPEQATRWIQLDTCPNGTFPALATALACA